MTTIKVLLFGPARDVAGGADFSLVEAEALPLSISALRSLMYNQHHELRFVLSNSIFAVDNTLVPKTSESNISISSMTTEVVLIPPVSGG